MSTQFARVSVIVQVFLHLFALAKLATSSKRIQMHGTIVCLTRVWQSLLPRFVTKRSSLPSKLGKPLWSTTTISRVCLLATIQTREIVLLAMDTFYNGT